MTSTQNGLSSWYSSCKENDSKVLSPTSLHSALYPYNDREKERERTNRSTQFCVSLVWCFYCKTHVYLLTKSMYSLIAEYVTAWHQCSADLKHIQKCKDWETKNYNFAGCFIWLWNLSLTMREECRLRFFDNRLLRTIFGPQRSEVTGEWRRLHNKELYTLTPHQISMGSSSPKDWDGQGMQHVLGKEQVHTVF